MQATYFSLLKTVLWRTQFWCCYGIVYNMFDCSAVPRQHWLKEQDRTSTAVVKCSNTHCLVTNVHHIRLDQWSPCNCVELLKTCSQLFFGSDSLLKSGWVTFKKNDSLWGFDTDHSTAAIKMLPISGPGLHSWLEDNECTGHCWV